MSDGRRSRTMDGSGTILLHFSCVGENYAVNGPDSAGLLSYVLDSDPALAGQLLAWVEGLYPDEPWSSPGNSVLRRLWGWVRTPADFPEIASDPDGRAILGTLELVRNRMSDAFRSRAYVRHVWPEVPAALRRWRAQGYRILSFDLLQPTEAQRTLLETVVPECDVEIVPIEQGISGAVDAQLLAAVADPNHTIVVLAAQAYRLAGRWRERRVRSVLVDRQWVLQPHLNPGYGFYVRALTDLDPDREMKRAYYEEA